MKKIIEQSNHSSVPEVGLATYGFTPDNVICGTKYTKIAGGTSCGYRIIGSHPPL